MLKVRNYRLRTSVGIISKNETLRTPNTSRNRRVHGAAFL